MSIHQIEDVKPDVQEDDVLGHKIIARVELSDACHDFTKNDIRRVLRKQIGSYEILAELFVVSRSEDNLNQMKSFLQTYKRA